MTKVVEVWRRVHGEEHPDTLEGMTNLAELYLRQDKYAESEALLTRVAEVQRRVLGEMHPDTLVSMTSLAAAYARQGKFTQAEALGAKVAAARRSALGKEHPRTLDSVVSLGHFLFLQQKYAQAEATLREALKGNEKTRPEAWQRYHCLCMLGASLAGERKFAEAEQFLTPGYEGLTQRKSMMSVDERSHQFTEAGEWIVNLYQSWGKPDKAAEWREKVQAQTH